MTPHEKFQVVFQKWLRLSSKSLGYNILDRNFKITFLTILTITAVLSQLIFCIYTMCAFNAEIACKGASLMSIGLQCTSKTYCILKYRPEILFLTSFLEGIYVGNESKPSIKTRSTMNKYATYIYNMTGTIFVLYVLSAFMFVVYQVLMFLLVETKELSIPINVPGIDVNTREGYISTSIYHYVVLYMGSAGLAFCDTLFLNLTFNVMTMSELQTNHLSMINDDLNANKKFDPTIRSRLSNFFLMHQEMERYIDIINKTHFWMIFIQISTTSLSTALIIYIIMAMSWLPAYLLAACLVFQLFLYCALGTVVDIANDNMEYAILQTDFYLLPLDLQVNYLFMVRIVQKAQCLKAAGFKLDVSTFVWIMRKIYTFIMLLYNIM